MVRSGRVRDNLDRANFSIFDPANKAQRHTPIANYYRELAHQRRIQPTGGRPNIEIAQDGCIFQPHIKDPAIRPIFIQLGKMQTHPIRAIADRNGVGKGHPALRDSVGLPAGSLGLIDRLVCLLYTSDAADE